MGRGRPGDGAAGRGAGRGGARLHRPSERRRGGPRRRWNGWRRWPPSTRARWPSWGASARRAAAIDQAVALYERAAAKEPDRSEQSALLHPRRRGAARARQGRGPRGRSAGARAGGRSGPPQRQRAAGRRLHAPRAVGRRRGAARSRDRQKRARKTTGRRDADRLAALRDAAGARLPGARKAGQGARLPGERARHSAPSFCRCCAPSPTSATGAASGRRRWRSTSRCWRLHRAALPAAELPDMFQRIGRARAELGDAEGAIAAYREVRALAPEPAARHRGALGAAGGQGGLARLGRGARGAGRHRSPTKRARSGRRLATPARPVSAIARAPRRPTARRWRRSPRAARRSRSCWPSSRRDDRHAADGRDALGAGQGGAGGGDAGPAAARGGAPPPRQGEPPARGGRAARALARRRARDDRRLRRAVAAPRGRHGLGGPGRRATGRCSNAFRPTRRARCNCGSGRGWGTWRCASCVIASWP